MENTAKFFAIKLIPSLYNTAKWIKTSCSFTKASCFLDVPPQEWAWDPMGSVPGLGNRAVCVSMGSLLPHPVAPGRRQKTKMPGWGVLQEKPLSQRVPWWSCFSLAQQCACLTQVYFSHRKPQNPPSCRSFSDALCKSARSPSTPSVKWMTTWR